MSLETCEKLSDKRKIKSCTEAEKHAKAEKYLRYFGMINTKTKQYTTNSYLVKPRIHAYIILHFGKQKAMEQR